MIIQCHAQCALAGQTAASLAAAQHEVEMVTPSLFARAFAGRTIPQGPNDESAAAAA